MILIGQFDSPFVRRVGIALTLYGRPFEHRPWSTFGDAALIAPYNPLTRVPTLVLDDGEVLIESAAMLDHLDEEAGPERALMARSGTARRRALRTCALAMGMCEKAVALVYERALHIQTSDTWIARCERQIAAVLDALEAERRDLAAPVGPGAAIGHAEIAIACAARFLGDAHPALFDPARWPEVAALSRHCEALPAFAAIQQRFIPPA